MKTCTCDCKDANCHVEEGGTPDSKGCGCCEHCDCTNCGEKKEEAVA